MIKQIFRVMTIIIGISFGLTLGPVVWHLFGLTTSNPWLMNRYVNAFIFTILFIVIELILEKLVVRLVKMINSYLEEQNMVDIIFATVSTLLGGLIGYWISLPIRSLNIPFLSTISPFIIFIVMSIVGYLVITSRQQEIIRFTKRFAMSRKLVVEEEVESQLLERKVDDNFHKYKLLDTSVIIDGRIADIMKTNVIEGILLVPNFVLHELQLISDSSDTLKRNKGRRGLDILNEMQKDENILIEIYDGDFEEMSDVDSKLVRLAKLLDAVVVTNDYNLNKVCEFHHIKVFNINALANALKPALVPGDEMEVTILKEGTERKQGVAYLEDGTMIVVEDGQYYMNERIGVVVTSALQTAAGRMIFAKPIHSQSKIENKY